MVKTLHERIKPIYANHGKFITRIAPLKEEENFFKFVIFFTDGTNLRVTEFYKEGMLDKYNFYHLDGKNNVISGWDNAPHHRHVKTFPHHKHFKKNILPSQERNLDDVLYKILSDMPS